MRVFYTPARFRTSLPEIEHLFSTPQPENRIESHSPIWHTFPSLFTTDSQKQIACIQEANNENQHG
jgi:hypothetical protein